MKKLLLWVLAGFAGWFIYSLIAMNVDQQYYDEQEYSDEYIEEYSEPIDSELQYVLRNIAGTYELVEHLGIYGFKTVYTVTINQDGTGRTVYNDGSVEYFNSARLSGSDKIVFNGDYGGTVFLLSGPGIEDESAKQYISEIGTPKYYMRKL